MTDDGPATPVPTRKPRKIFLLVGVVVAVGLGIGLFTSLGTTTNATTGPPHDGGKVPAFSGKNLNGTGTVRVSDDSSPAAPTVLLFFGNWCSACHAELPPLAAAVHRQQARADGPLSTVRVIGVDSEDAPPSAHSFITHSGVTFPVAYDPDLTITEGDFYFHGDPDAVFIRADGTIAKIVRGQQLSPAAFTADEKALTPSGM